ncbi:hypothetical protein JCM10212_006951 [Sporobolomyces blumeae]
MLAAVAQMCSTANVSRNRSIACDLIRRAAAVNSKLLLLPEATDFIAPADQVKHLSQTLEQEGGFVESIRKQAKESGIWVGVGVHEKGPGDKCYNTNVLINDRGDLVETYRKIHLFDVAIKGGMTILESNTTIPGNELRPPVSTPIGKVGLLTCYDCRFPELSLSLRRQGSQIITYPSAFSVKTGKAHWGQDSATPTQSGRAADDDSLGAERADILLRTRAIETQCYVLAPAQAGTHAPGRQSYGHALIASPWGTVLASTGTSEMAQDDEGVLVTAEIDLDLQASIRQEMPLWDQRRFDVYAEL